VPNSHQGPNVIALPLIALLTDFGLEDGYPGIMKGVIAGIAPQACLVDITHLIPAQDIATGAWVLYTAWRYFPPGTIFLCVVDPGVGTSRRPVSLHAGDRFFVGPDNGIFSYVLSSVSESGGPIHVVELNRDQFYLAPLSATFAGRDLFAPCAAHLAAGIALEDLGTPIDPEGLSKSAAPPPPVRSGGRLFGAVAHCDHFGNVITNFGSQLTELVLKSPKSVLTINRKTVSARAATYAVGPEGEPFLLPDSSGHLAIAVRNASAATWLGDVLPGTSVVVAGL
jgi:S-adenosyl-L-methionine hydrolase (adenosine-forming)